MKKKSKSKQKDSKSVEGFAHFIKHVKLEALAGQYSMYEEIEKLPKPLQEVAHMVSSLAATIALGQNHSNASKLLFWELAGEEIRHRGDDVEDFEAQMKKDIEDTLRKCLASKEGTGALVFFLQHAVFGEGAL